MAEEQDDSWDLPEGFVFDEEFVRGGRHEPPARTRAAIARHGERKTSDRQAAPPTAAPTGSRGSRAFRRPRRRRTRELRLPLIASATVSVIVVGLVVFRSIAGGHSGSIIAGAAPAQVAGTIVAASGPGATHADSAVVHGYSITDAVGTCYTADTLTGAASRTLTSVDCTAPHDLELASREQAAGADNAYPDSSYWDGPVAQACDRDLVGYLGGQATAWPAGTTPEQLEPRQDGWVLGDRVVSCLAKTVPRRTGSIRNTAGANPSSAPAPSR